MRLFNVFLFVLFSNLISAQNLTGVWRGESVSPSGEVLIDDFEMQIVQENSSLIAFITYSNYNYKSGERIRLIHNGIAVLKDNADDYYFNANDSCNCGSNKEELNKNTEDSSTSLNIIEKESHCTILNKEQSSCLRSNFSFRWYAKGNEQYLSATSMCNSCTIKNSYITLRKTGKISNTQYFMMKKKSLKKVPTLVVSPFVLNFEKSGISSLKPVLLTNETKLPVAIETRKNEKLKTIKVNSKQVELSIYDYGRIDHDIVSVYVDKKPILVKEELTRKPLIVNLEMDKNNNYHEVILVAENLGDIPPNTALMKIKAGNETHEVKITSDEQKNAVIVFKYKE